MVMIFSGAALDLEEILPGETVIWEMGFGLQLTGIPGGIFTLRCPFMVDPPPIGEDKYDERWMVSFTPNFKY